MNEFWNMQRDYQPLNESVKELELRLTYQPLSFIKWQLFAAHTMKNKWTISVLGKFSLHYCSWILKQYLFSQLKKCQIPFVLMNTCFPGDTSEDDGNDQDLFKETLLETNPYLLGMTVIVSIFHSVFEFLAFKNGKWYLHNLGDSILARMWLKMLLLAPAL